MQVNSGKDNIIYYLWFWYPYQKKTCARKHDTVGPTHAQVFGFLKHYSLTTL